MKFLESMIVWNPGTDQIDVVPWPDENGSNRRYRMSDGACYADYHKMTPDRLMMMMFIAFHTAVIRDRVPIDAAHRAFCKIDEFRKRIAPDAPGAENT